MVNFAGRRLSIVTAVMAAATLPGCERPVSHPAAEAGRRTPVALGELSAEGLGRVLRDGSARATVVNVWATWCLPCREEFPDLLRFGRDYRARGVRLLLISADFAGRRRQAEEFLAGHGVDFTSYLKVGPDMEFIDALSKDWSGSLPATFVFDGNGVLRASFEGKIDYETVVAGVEPLLRSGDAREGG